MLLTPLSSDFDAGILAQDESFVPPEAKGRRWLVFDGENAQRRRSSQVGWLGGEILEHDRSCRAQTCLLLVVSLLLLMDVLRLRTWQGVYHLRFVGGKGGVTCLLHGATEGDLHAEA